ncbi:MAG: DUF3592 domain-containing protein [Terriglobales bacterium]
MHIYSDVSMFEDLYDEISFLWSWRWPIAEGEITAVDVERIRHQRSTTTRLAIAYRFSVYTEGPYTGESFWEPAFFAAKRIQRALHNFHVHQRVKVRYRADDPSVNKLDGSAWRKIAG